LTLCFHHVALSVPDIDAAAFWYADMLGFAVERRFSLPAGTKALFLRRDEMRIELFEVVDPAPLPPDRSDPRKDLHTLGHKHFCFATSHYEDWRTRLLEKGVAIILEVGDGKADRGLFFNDLAGNVIEIVAAG
jgi:catechol 2,3-dioxygenase-like lactoylglutathione lyase family enzyme